MVISNRALKTCAIDTCFFPFMELPIPSLDCLNSFHFCTIGKLSELHEAK